MEKTKGRGNKGGRALGDYLMFLRNERKNIFSPKYRNKKSIHFLTPTLSRTTNVIYSQSLPLASGNMRIGKLRNTLS